MTTYTQQQPNGTWRAFYATGSGKARLTRSKSGFHYAWEAEDWAKAQADAVAADLIDTPPDQAPDAVTWGRSWLANLQVARDTRNNYASCLDAIGRHSIGHRPITHIERRHVQAWIRDLADDDIGTPTINRRLKVLRMILRDAATNPRGSGLTADPTAGVKYIQHAEREGVYLNADQRQRILTACANLHPTGDAARDPGVSDLWLQARIALECGLRLSEVLALPVSAFTDDGGPVVTVRQRIDSVGVRPGTKPGIAKIRIVPLPVELADALAPRIARARLRRGPEGLLFTGAGDRPLDKSNWRDRWWDKAVTETGLNPSPDNPAGDLAQGRNLGFHDLRHTYGSDLDHAGVPIELISELMGHAETRTTRTYIHRRPGRAAAVARDAMIRHQVG